MVTNHDEMFVRQNSQIDGRENIFRFNKKKWQRWQTPLLWKKSGRNEENSFNFIIGTYRNDVAVRNHVTLLFKWHFDFLFLLNSSNNKQQFDVLREV